MRRIIWTVCFILILAVSFGLVAYDFGFDQGVAQRREVADSQSERTQPAHASLMIDFGDGGIKSWQGIDISAWQSPTVWDITKKITDEQNIELMYKEYGSLGVLVESIGGKANQGTERAWQFWVNNQYATKGAGQYVLHAGDVVVWKYTKGQL